MQKLDLPWWKLDNCNILITGATGLIGSNIVNILMSMLDKQYQIFASGRNEERARKLFAPYLDDPAFHFIRYDVTQPLQNNIDFHYIIDAASNASPNFFSTQPVEVMMSNLLGVRNLLNYGLSHNLRRFLYISTGEIYGQDDGRIFTEDSCGYVPLMSSRSCYPNSKRAAETLCASYAAEYGVDVVVARLCHVYGSGFPDQDNRVYAQFIRNVLRRENIVMKSKGEQIRSWCYVDDCVSALLYILLKGKKGEAYNVADSSSVISIKQLAEMIAEIGGCKVIEDIYPDAKQKDLNPMTFSVLSTEKVEALGWQPSCKPMKQKMEETIIKCMATSMQE